MPDPADSAIVPAPSLAAFQARFAAAIIGATNDEGFIDTALTAQPGFAVYRNTSAAAAVDALAANYPRIETLLGIAAFRSLAVDYARRYPPETPVLGAYGEHFATFLQGHEVQAELPYLADVARIDRLWTETYFAPDAAPLTPASFAALDLAANPGTVVGLHPASAHAWLATPAGLIWATYGGGDASAAGSTPEIDWRPGGVHVTRGVIGIVVDRVAAAEIALLDALGAGQPLLASAAGVLEAFPETDLPSIIARLLDRGALTAPR